MAKVTERYNPLMNSWIHNREFLPMAEPTESPPLPAIEPAARAAIMEIVATALDGYIAAQKLVASGKPSWVAIVAAVVGAILGIERIVQEFKPAPVPAPVAAPVAYTVVLPEAKK